MAQESHFRLHITGPDVSRVFEVLPGTTTIGRQPGNDLVLEHPQVSRLHARIDCSATGCQIVDLGSSNGMTVNHKRLVPQVPVLLAPGAIIRIGPFELAVEQVQVESPRAEEKSVVAEPPGTVNIPLAPEPVEPPHEPEIVDHAATPPEIPPVATPPNGTLGAVPFGDGRVLPGLSTHSRHLLNYLPGIYHTDFMVRFLAIFESVLIPIEWNIDNFDLYLDPGTAPCGFLPWLANWFQITLDSTWSEEQRRTLLREAHKIYARRGTRWALSRILEIYTGHRPKIRDVGQDLEPFAFSVKLPMPANALNRELVERLIDAHKPAHTTYTLEFQR